MTCTCQDADVQNTCIGRYTWQGTANLQQTIEHLRHQDLSQPSVSAQVAGARKGADSVTLQLNLAACVERKEKSLGLLAQRFVQMLLCVTEDQAVALDDAAKSLLGIPRQPSHVACGSSASGLPQHAVQRMLRF